MFQDEANEYWLGNDWDWRSHKFVGDYPNLYYDTLVMEPQLGADEAQLFERAALLAQARCGTLCRSLSLSFSVSAFLSLCPSLSLSRSLSPASPSRFACLPLVSSYLAI